MIDATYAIAAVAIAPALLSVGSSFNEVLELQAWLSPLPEPWNFVICGVNPTSLPFFPKTRALTVFTIRWL